jgi:hypothetical protein
MLTKAEGLAAARRLDNLIAATLAGATLIVLSAALAHLAA